MLIVFINLFVVAFILLFFVFYRKHVPFVMA